MKLGFSAAEEEFRRECADWLNGQMAGEFKDIKGITTLTEKAERRKEWEQQLAAHKWSCIGWPEEWGGRAATLAQQVIFAEEYARAGVPGRVNHIGVELAGPTLLAFGTDAQKNRFLPGIAAGQTIFCQGFSEPGAGSDLASVRTKARLEGDEWVVNGQKIWTSLAHISDWIFVVSRSEEGSKGPKGLTFLMMEIDQPGIEIRPIKQINGDAEFNEEMREHGLERMFLHASSISFLWPDRGTEFSVNAPLPPELARVIDALAGLKRPGRARSRRPRSSAGR